MRALWECIFSLKDFSILWRGMENNHRPVMQIFKDRLRYCDFLPGRSGIGLLRGFCPQIANLFQRRIGENYTNTGQCSDNSRRRYL